MKWMSIRPYAESTGLMALVTALGFFVQRTLHTANIDIVYLLGVLVIALRWGRRPAMFTAVASAVVFDFCFITPYFSFAMSDLAYLITAAGFLVVAAATSELASRSQRLAREETARARAEARSEAKDEILNKVSHELRAPINALVGWTQLAARSDIDIVRLRKALDGISHSGDLLKRLVDDLMTGSRMNSGKLPVERRIATIDPIVTNSVAAMTTIAEHKGVQVEAAIEPVGLMLVDEQRIEQIVTNLLSNAIKFTPPGGRVSVRLHRMGGEAELVVSDTGIGIPSDFLPRIFEAFSQADVQNAKQGLGLGMSIVKHLVNAHGGSVSVTSNGQGQGTTSTVLLPTISTDAGPALPL